MRGRIVFPIFGLILICFIFNIIVSKANSENFWEFPFPPKPPPPPARNPGKGTEEASVLVLHSFSKLFIIFEILEHRNIYEANKMLTEVRAAQLEAVAIYKDIASKTPSTLTGRADLPDEKIKMIKNDFNLFRLEIPKSYSDIAYLAYKEVSDLAEFMNKVNFTDDPAKNRQTAREIVERLYRYMRLGISISEIAASWTMK